MPILSLWWLVACVGVAEREQDKVDEIDTGETDSGEAPPCEVPAVWYYDADKDGYGNETLVRASCDQPDGYVPVAGDCDDSDASAFPAAVELCDDVDGNCNGVVDDDEAEDRIPFYSDADGDGAYGYVEAGLACSAVGEPSSDCDDGDNDIYPGAPEHCDEVDEDCDAEIDELTDLIDAITLFADVDGDGFGDPTVNILACGATDGYVANDSDCDDAQGNVYPTASEHCDGIDEDCDDAIDNSPVDPNIYFLDEDADGFGGTTASITGCTVPSGYAESSDDCDDEDSEAFPGAPELCNGRDDDCAGDIDEDDATDVVAWYADTDGDSYGNLVLVEWHCDVPVGFVANPDDCDDALSAAYPGAPEACGGTDYDCDGAADEPESVDAATWYADADGDGWGNAAISQVACDEPVDYTATSEDCDDLDAAISPSGTESCDDGIDQDCTGVADDGCGPLGELTAADADLIVYGDVANAYIGLGGPVAGDVTGDGIDDMLTTNSFNVKVIDGSLSGEVLSSSLPSFASSGSVLSIGDYDGDGVADVAVGQGYGATYSTWSAYTGPLDATTTSDFSGSGTVPAMADFNDDGWDDLVWRATNTTTNKTEIYVDLSPVRGSNAILTQSNADTGYSSYATTLSTGVDITGDGLPDLAAYDNGAVYFVSGTSLSVSATLTDAADTVLSTALPYGPERVDLAQDLNGDGDNDVLVSHQYADNGGSKNGTVYIAYGPIASLTALSSDRIVGAADYEYAGNASDADVDGDDVGDILSRSGGGATEAWLHYGPISGTVYTFDADATWAEGGAYAFTSAGDPLGTGQESILVGLPYDDGRAADGGAMLRFLGGGR